MMSVLDSVVHDVECDSNVRSCGWRNGNFGVRSDAFSTHGLHLVASCKIRCFNGWASWRLLFMRRNMWITEEDVGCFK